MAKEAKAGERVRIYRERLDMSIYDLSQKSGISEAVKILGVASVDLGTLAAVSMEYERKILKLFLKRTAFFAER